MNIGEKIRAARLSKGYTQEELGAMLGLQKSAIAKYESGRVVNIKRSTLKQISDILGIHPAELIFDTNTYSTKNLPLTDLDEEQLDRELIRLLCSLTESEISRVNDFIKGILASREP